MTESCWSFWYTDKIRRRKRNRTLPSTLPQIFSESILNFQVIVESIRDPDDKSVFRGRFEVEMSIIALPPTLPQIFPESILNSQVIVKIVRDPDNDSGHVGEDLKEKC